MQPLTLNAFPLRFGMRNRLAALWAAGHFSLPRFLVSLMAKVPFRKFSTAKKKIPSRKFPKSQSKIPSRKFAKGSATIASRKFPQAPANEKQAAQVRLDRPTDETSRQDRLKALKGRMKSLLPASNLWCR
jgi:hypothetical protein